MTLEQDEVDVGVFGLGDSFPHPGWVVLDAARHHGFTGELTFETIPTVKVYLDGGMIYLAERVTDPSLGSRLVDAGALNAAQLEHGSMLLGDVAHLGRLFERVPSVNRQTVMVMTEMMTEECVRWLAGQLVRNVDLAPYRHHPAGVQRWLHPPTTHHLAPGDPLPAPPIDAIPVELVAPEPLFSPEGSYDDELITWDQPSWLDERPVAPATIDVPDEPSTEAIPAPPDSSATEPVPVADAPAARLPSITAPDADQQADPVPVEDLPELPVRIRSASVADQVAAGDWTGRTSDVPEVPDTDASPERTGEEPSLAVESALNELMAAPPEASADTATPEIDEHDADLPRPSGTPTAQPDQPTPPVVDDWVDRLDSDGLPEPGVEPVLSTMPPPPGEPVAIDRFEVIWPSGQIDDQLGSTNAGITDLDSDGAGPAARMAPTVEPPVGDRVAAPVTLEPPDQATETFVPASDEMSLGDDEVTDEVVLAVRRAVASIETSSLAARRRLVATEPDGDPSRGVASERPIRSLRPVSETSDALTPGATSARRVPTRSVFDDELVVPDAPQPSALAEEPVLPVLPPATPAPVVEQRQERVGALRRLIGSLRRR